LHHRKHKGEKTVRILCYLTAAKPRSRSAMMSSMCSVPMERSRYESVYHPSSIFQKSYLPINLPLTIIGESEWASSTSDHGGNSIVLSVNIRDQIHQRVVENTFLVSKNR